VDASDLEGAVGEYESQVGAAVERDAALLQLVARLENEFDREPAGEDPGGMASGDTLAQEIERFLRQRDEPGSQ
jgi:hypothetical protein